MWTSGEQGPAAWGIPECGRHPRLPGTGFPACLCGAGSCWDTPGSPVCITAGHAQTTYMRHGGTCPDHVLQHSGTRLDHVRASRWDTPRPHAAAQRGVPGPRACVTAGCAQTVCVSVSCPVRKRLRGLRAEVKAPAKGQFGKCPAVTLRPTAGHTCTTCLTAGHAPGSKSEGLAPRPDSPSCRRGTRLHQLPFQVYPWAAGWGLCRSSGPCTGAVVARCSRGTWNCLRCHGLCVLSPQPSLPNQSVARKGGFLPQLCRNAAHKQVAGSWLSERTATTATRGDCSCTGRCGNPGDPRE